MICPNCGREFSDTARTCPSCGAVQQMRRRRQRTNDAEKPHAVRIQRSVTPPKQQPTSRSEDASAGVRKKPEKPVSPLGSAGRPIPDNVPLGLRKQTMQNRDKVRHVRHAPIEYTRKTDARPAMKQPPIYEKSHKKLIHILEAVSVVLLCVVCSGAYLLFFSETGQQMMAQWGWSLARTDAYITLGKSRVEMGYFSGSLEPLSIAVEREPDNVDALNLMAQAYMELGRREEAKAIYESLISTIAPNHPSAYRNLIRIYEEDGYYAEALELTQRAADNTSDPQEFNLMLRENTPPAPVFSMTEGKYTNEIDITISIPEGETVYYSTDGTDPSESGLVYVEGTVIHAKEGKLTLMAIGFSENGTPSDQVSATYTIVIPTPAAPKSNIASGKYKYAPKVSLRPGDEDDKNASPIVAIYYTLDGRQATLESTLYNPDEPIQLPIGSSTLRAVALAANGKTSYEMKVTYKVEGNLKKVFSSKDTFRNMELYSTGYSSFTKAWGAPQSYELLPEAEWYSPEMESYEAIYSWGYARFCIKKKGGSPVLYALDTANDKMSGPRSTKVGTASTAIIDAFRDLGQPALDDDGNRLLYNTDSAGYQFGTFRREPDGVYAIHYYYPVDDNHTIFVELSYYLDSKGNAERIVWQRYKSEL